MAEKSAAKKNNKIVSFFKGLKAEIRKIAWPNRETTLKQTAAVVIISLILCGIIRLIDVLAQLGVGALNSIF